MPGPGVIVLALALSLLVLAALGWGFASIWAPRPTLGDFELWQGWYGGADPIARSDELELLLEEADRLSRTIKPGQRVVFFVVDRDDPERGWADWADCGKHGTFDAGGECPRCR
jgi:hypothetical protein